jgi:cysteine-S-conjugate beta-lyase
VSSPAIQSSTLFEAFDTVVDRRGTGSEKWDVYAGTDTIPLWIADMDFPAPAVVIEALQAHVAHGVFGYARPTPELIDVALAVLAREHGVQADAESLVWLPGLVSGLHAACAAVGTHGDGVVVMTPSYPPFLLAPPRMGRRCIEVPLADAAGAIDFDALEAAIGAPGNACRLLMLCNPHNPTGRVYDPETLYRLGALCERHDLIVVSDEIHAGLILEPGARHTAIAALSPALAERCITLVAPSKTYNIAGLGCALAVIPNRLLREAFRKAGQGLVPGVNALGYTAALAAWRDGEPWRQALLSYLRGNRDLVVQAVDAHPGLCMRAPQATYLAWIDASRLGAPVPQFAFEAAGLGTSDGRAFADMTHVRLNFACPRATLREALVRLAAVGRT